MLLITEQLDDVALTDLNHFMQHCKQHDGHMIAYYPQLLKAPRPKPATLLHYDHQQRLAAFAAAFFFEHEVAEIALATAPEHRRQGLAHHLLSSLLTSIQQERSVNTVRFSVPFNQQHDHLVAQNFTHHHSEYEMHYAVQQPIVLDDQGLQFITATTEHIAHLRALDSQCFPQNTPFTTERFMELLADPNYRITLLVQGEQIVGKAHIAFRSNQTAHLSDIAVSPAQQRKGYGRQLIRQCMQQAWLAKQAHITLCVETKNQQALRLYQQLDFTISNAIDFWEKPLACFTA